jgi:ABC-type glycerol-3-phosphate transport system substrate-binding protein
MNGLRPFDESEIARSGGRDSVMPIAWKTSVIAGDHRVWSMPFTLDSRCIFFWEDMLEDANVDPETAFATPEAVAFTLERLQAAGIRAPWAAPMTSSILTLQHLASWIWQYGGDLVNENGKHLMLLEPAALRGLVDYFQLDRFTLADELTDEGSAINLFLSRRSAAIMGGSWILNGLPESRREMLPARLGVALPPGPSFVGGTSLIIMNHIAPRDERLALNIIRQLNTPEFQAEYCHGNIHLPARIDALESDFFAKTPQFRPFIHALETGRVSPALPRWGIVEERLKESLANIWADIHGQPDAPVESLIVQCLEPAMKRLDLILSQ